MVQQISRLALGQEVAVGTFYNARTDSFLPLSLLPARDLEGVVSRQKMLTTDVQLSYDGSYAEKFKRLRIGPDLGASLLSGLMQASLFDQFLDQTILSEKVLQATLYHEIITVQERLNLTSPNIKKPLNSDSIRTSDITHIITEVEYGSQSIITARYWATQDSPLQQVESQFRVHAERFADSVRNPHAEDVDGHKGPNLPLEIIAYSTLLNTDGIVMCDLAEALEFIDLVRLQMKNDDASLLKPIVYHLLPIQMIGFLDLIQVHEDGGFTALSPECSKSFVEIFDEFHLCKQKLQEFVSYASKHKLCLPKGYVEDVSNLARDLDISEQNLRDSYAHVLHDVRRGRSNPDRLEQLLNDASNGDSSPQRLLTFLDDQMERLTFIDTMLAEGAVYIGHNGLQLKFQLSKWGGGMNHYIMSFSELARSEQTTWKANNDMLFKLLEEPGRSNFIAIVDCDAFGTRLERARISQYRDGKEVVADMLEDAQYLADNCFARCSLQTVEKEVQKPTKRGFVKISCPGRGCDEDKPCDWQCLECRAPVEFGFLDQYMYCDCGRSLYSNYDFRCNAGSHGTDFETYEPQCLLALLKSLDQSNYLNVLILGETGVGKSTFINAFVNYLFFDSLDDALNSEEFKWVIPCSFSTQTMDRSNPDSEIVETKVRVGLRDDEHDGSGGQAATQTTNVYSVSRGNRTYRLIDTPGIGDTRGFEYDKSNMADILKTVSSYDDLHGILILLRSNNARLTAHFSFCVKELLIHLHRSAANNVVFGFTNTRISNYAPGDTWGALKSLLNERSEIGLSLSTQTTYCFDSESFRYLAAYKNGVHMDNKTDFDGSWTKSSKETWRMLDHFDSKPPHPVKSTMNLNGTRQLITELTKPMAEISQLIRTNISMTEDHVLFFKDAKLTRDQLLAKLNPQKQLMRKKGIDKPRTVCGDKACVEFRDDGTASNKMLADYPRPCHPICYLNNVQIDVTAHPNLLGCAAFGGQNECNSCGHHWSLHMHILYELETYTTIVQDIGIAKQLDDHASDLALRQSAIEARQRMIEEYKEEHEQIQEAAAKFGLWMKKNAMLHYNDATLAYLDVLIHDEQAKVDAGGVGHKQKVLDLQKDVAKHKELVALLTKNMGIEGKSQPIDQDDVDRLVKHLFNLKHFGKNLEHLKTEIAQSHERTNRERPLRVDPRNMSRRSSTTTHVLRHSTGSDLRLPPGERPHAAALQETLYRPGRHPPSLAVVKDIKPSILSSWVRRIF